MSSFGLIASCALLWAGVMTLLWHILPVWLLIGGIVIPAIGGLVSSLASLSIVLDVTIIPEFITDGEFMSTIAAWLLILFLNFHLVSFDREGKEIKRFLAIRKISLWYPIMILIACIVDGVLGGFAVQSWFHLALPLSMLVVGFGCLLCSMLYVWTIAFLRSSEILIWLEEHPGGQALLDEFRP